MNIVRLSGVTDASGNLSVSVNPLYEGYVERLNYQYVDASAGSITVTQSLPISQTIWTDSTMDLASIAVYPRVVPVSTTNNAITQGYSKIHITGILNMTVTGGGNAKTVIVDVIMSDYPRDEDSNDLGGL